METIAELVQMHPEEGHGGFDAALAHEAKVEYEAALEFAGLQVRARALTTEAWNAYMREADKTQVLDDLLDNCGAKMCSDSRAVVAEELGRLSKVRHLAFKTWSELSAIANAEGRAALSLEQVQAGIAALVRLEQNKADDLLKAQAYTRRSRKAREEVKREEAEACATCGSIEVGHNCVQVIEREPVAVGAPVSFHFDDDNPFADE